MIWPTWILDWWKAFVGAAVVVFPAFFLGQCSGAAHERKIADAARAVANVEMVQKDVDIKEVIEQQRREDDAKINEQKKELTDAVANLPDNIPSARRVALACAELRSQGTDTVGIPACDGFANPGAAPANSGSVK